MSLNRRSALHGTAFGLAGVLLLTLLPSQGRSDYLNQPLRRYTGYTRPGSPPDQVSRDGKIIFVADDPDERKKAIGGTVYFTVLDRAKGAEGDTWGTGFKNFDLNFVRGGMFEGGASPGLDTAARYLYLYQTVNDRGTDGVVTSTAIRLLVDPRSITSWGYFSGIGFGTLTNEEEGGKKPGVGPAAFKPGEGGRRTVIRPVSAEVVPPSAALPENRVYRDPAPAILGVESLFLSTVATPKEAAAARAVGGIVGIALEVSLDPAHNPDAVLLVTGREFFDRPYVRADWRASNVLRKGERSSLFGFTSNDPPTLDAVRVRGATLPAIVPAAGEITEADLTPTAAAPTGEVPTPIAPAAFGDVGLGGLGTFGPLGGLPLGGLGGGGGGLGGGGLGGLGGGRGAAGFPGGGTGSGGGGSGSGTPATAVGTTGTGNQGQQGQQGQQNQQQQQQGVPPLTLSQQVSLAVQLALTQNTTVNQTQNQSQSQTQSQSQSQTQSQTQNQNTGGGGTPPTEVVPEPAAFILAGLGLPFLLAAVRRKRKAAGSATPA